MPYRFIWCVFGAPVFLTFFPFEYIACRYFKKKEKHFQWIYVVFFALVGALWFYHKSFQLGGSLLLLSFLIARFLYFPSEYQYDWGILPLAFVLTICSNYM